MQRWTGTLTIIETDRNTETGRQTDPKMDRATKHAERQTHK
jgi:hypothetical protein